MLHEGGALGFERGRGGQRLDFSDRQSVLALHEMFLKNQTGDWLNPAGLIKALGNHICWRQAIEAFEYAKARASAEASVRLYGAILGALAAANRPKEALDIWQSLKEEEELRPNTLICNSLLKALSGWSSTLGRRAATGGGNLITRKHRRFGEAALQVWQLMVDQGPRPDRYTATPVLKALAPLGMWRECSSVLRDMEMLGLRLQNPHLTLAISACGAARPPVPHEVQRLLNLAQFVPDTVTYSAALSTYEQYSDWAGAMWVLDEMEKDGVELNRFCYASLIILAGKVGRSDDALQILAEAEAAEMAARQDTSRQVSKGYYCTEFLYASTVKSVVQHNGDLNKACRLLERMQDRGFEVSATVLNLLLDGFASQGRWQEAVEALKTVCRKTGVVPDVVSFNTLIAACSRADPVAWLPAMSLTQLMRRRGLTPDTTAANTLAFCALHANETEFSRELASHMCLSGLERRRSLVRNSTERTLRRLLGAGEASLDDVTLPESVRTVIGDTIPAADDGTYVALLLALQKSNSLRLSRDLVSAMADLGCRPRSQHLTILAGTVTHLARCGETGLSEGRRFLEVDLPVLLRDLRSDVVVDSKLLSAILLAHASTRDFHAGLSQCEVLAQQGRGSKEGTLRAALIEYIRTCANLRLFSSTEPALRRLLVDRRTPVDVVLASAVYVVRAAIGGPGGRAPDGADGESRSALMLSGERDTIRPAAWSSTLSDVLRSFLMASASAFAPAPAASTIGASVGSTAAHFASSRWREAEAPMALYNEAVKIFQSLGETDVADEIYRLAVSLSLVDATVEGGDVGDGRTAESHATERGGDADGDGDAVLIDLHGFSAPLAQTAIRATLFDLLGQTTITHPTLFPRVVIITGKGRNSRHQPVLREVVQQMLVEEFYPPISSTTVPGNEGRLEIENSGIRKWVAYSMTRKKALMQRLRRAVEIQYHSDPPPGGGTGGGSHVAHLTRRRDQKSKDKKRGNGGS